MKCCLLNTTWTLHSQKLRAMVISRSAQDQNQYSNTDRQGTTSPPQLRSYWWLMLLEEGTHFSSRVQPLTRSKDPINKSTHASNYNQTQWASFYLQIGKQERDFLGSKIFPEKLGGKWDKGGMRRINMTNMYYKHVQNGQNTIQNNF